MKVKKKIAVIGGGAAGFFFAINCAEKKPLYQIDIFEKSPKVLEKVRISGGGRCNVTHACFEPKALAKNYPRGEKEMIGPFYQFQPQDVIAWFEKRGVKLKTEADGRMFPTTDNSETIMDCFLNEAKKNNITIHTQTGIDAIKKTTNGWLIKPSRDSEKSYDAVFVATGNAAKMWEILAAIGHNLAPPVPSLFTFKIKDKLIDDLMGVSVKNATVKFDKKNQETGPILITHWGLSGPAILRLSAWGAKALSEVNHQFQLIVNWTGTQNSNQVSALFKQQKNIHSKKQITNQNLFDIPTRLWERLCEIAGIKETEIWADTSNKKLEVLAQHCTNYHFDVMGKATNKDEFVTAGGVNLREIDFKTMESKLLSGLYFGGEVLNIDAITGGFNFQAAWTTAWVAAKAI